MLPAPEAAALPTGGTVTYTTTAPYYAIHTFTADGDFTIPAGATFTANYIVAAGGGGGGTFVAGPLQAAAGGGGGGGVLAGTSATLTPGTYHVVVGSGGAAATNGNNSSWNGLVAIGGGRGASVNSGADAAGNGGAGGGSRCGIQFGGTGVAGQGFGGGSNALTCAGVAPDVGATNAGSGGGGASSSGTGSTLVNAAGGTGGLGRQGFTGVGVFYGGGGGGAASKSGTNTNAGAGGSGVGGKGATSSTPAVAGTDGRGGGGGGGNFANPTGGRGGSGVVMLRYNVGFVSYNANTASSGVAPSDSPYIANGETTPVAAPGALGKTGYRFTGWNTAANGTGTTYQPNDAYATITKTTLYAQWAPIDYQVAFDGHGADGGSMVNEGFIYDTPQNLTPNGWTRVGYTFTGWNSAADGSGTPYADQQSVSNLTATEGAVVQLYAQWTANHYTVSFDPHGGGGGSMAPEGFTFDQAQALTANGFTRVGYLFDHWSTAPDGSGTSYADQASVSNLTSVPEGSVTLYAQWTPIDYVVGFRSNGGSGSMADQPFSFDAAQDLTANAFTRTGWDFTGWNTAADGSGTSYADGANVVNLTDVDGATVPLYAQWSAHHYTVSFDDNGGGGGPMADQAFTYGTPQDLAANTFTRTGYDFSGWNAEVDGSGTSYADGATVSDLTATDGATVTLFAQWRAHHYSVSFDGNGGDGSMPVQSFVYDQAQELATHEFTRTGYAFTGWNTAADGSGQAYADRESVNNLTDVDEARVALFAQWAPADYRVAFDANGGSGSMPEQDFVFDQQQALLESTLTRPGYHFAGWNTAADGSGASYSDQQVVSNLTEVDGATIRLYAVWAANTYTIRFDSGGVTGQGARARTVVTQQATYGESFTLRANTFTRAGYRFVGWDTQRDGGGTSYRDGATVRNLTTVDHGTVTLWAQWTKVGGGPTGQHLPDTGGPSLVGLLAGVLLLIAGAVLVVARRRQGRRPGRLAP